MNQVPFKLENLKQLDFGLIAESFSAELQHVTKDCQDRPHDETARTVTIKFNLKPVPDATGRVVDLDSVNVEAEITSSVPKRRT